LWTNEPVKAQYEHGQIPKRDCYLHIASNQIISGDVKSEFNSQYVVL